MRVYQCFRYAHGVESKEIFSLVFERNQFVYTYTVQINVEINLNLNRVSFERTGIIAAITARVNLIYLFTPSKTMTL